MATAGQRLLDASGKRNVGTSGKARVSDGTDECEALLYYEFRSCTSGTLQGIYILASAAPFTPSSGTPWTIFDQLHQICLYTEGDTGTPPTAGDILHTGEYSTIKDCSNVICGITTPLDPPVESTCECPESSGEFLPDQVIVSINVTACTCDGTNNFTLKTANVSLTCSNSGSGCTYIGYARIELDAWFQFIEPCDTLAKAYEAYLTVIVGYTPGSGWSGGASFDTLYEIADGTAYGTLGFGYFSSSEFNGDCSGGTVNGDGGPCDSDDPGTVATGGTLSVTVPSLPP